MVWLSIDSKSRCSCCRKSRGCSSSSLLLLSITPPLTTTSHFLLAPEQGTTPPQPQPTWRPTPVPTPSPGRSHLPPSLSLSTAVAAVGLLLFSMFVMIVRSDDPFPSQSAPPNSSKLFLRYSILPGGHPNQTNKVAGIGGVGGSDSYRELGLPRHSQHPLRQASYLNRIGRARHRHPPYLPWFDSPAQAATAASTVPSGFQGPSRFTDKGVSSGGDGARPDSQDSLAEIVLPRKTFSHTGAKCNLPHHSCSSSSPENQEPPKRYEPSTGDRDGTLVDPQRDWVSHAKGQHEEAAAADGDFFTRKRRLFKKDFLGNMEPDSLTIESSRTLCLTLDSTSAIDRACSAASPDPSNDSSLGPGVTPSSNFTSFQFCTHLMVTDFARPTDSPCWREDGATEDECRQCLGHLLKRDDQAKSMYESLEILLSKFDCEDPYSTESTCDDCKIAYRHWVCSVTIPHYHDMERIQPCSHYSEMVENRCPYLSPHSQFQYAGEPVFLNTHTIFEETNLRSCHYLCQDHFINPQTEDRYAINRGHRSNCNTSGICILTIDEEHGDGELTETTEVALISRLLEVPSGERARRLLETSTDTWTEMLDDDSSQHPDLDFDSRPRTILSSNISSNVDDNRAGVETGFIPSSACKSCSINSILCVFLIVSLCGTAKRCLMIV